MLKMLRDRLVRLGRDEDGVALVVTLGIFMFLYVVCASVYAVGMAVKEKLHLQGACDAAAYSAAIVQADTFSRIATINRAMSWTYQQMTRRQMDYIVWQWLKETVWHYDHDEAAAKKYVNARVSAKCPNRGKLLSKGIGWDIDDPILNETHSRTRNELNRLCGGGGKESFGRHLRDQRGSFYLRRRNHLLKNGDKDCGLGQQIDEDLRNIRDMSAAVELLAKDLPDHIDDAVRGILAANIPSYMSSGSCQYFIRQSSDPRGDYLETFPNDKYHELVFLSLGNKIYQDTKEAFGAGSDSWFVPDTAGTGFRRHYPRNRSESPLVSNWNWWAIGWKCAGEDAYGNHRDVRTSVASESDCTHRHGRCRCSRGDRESLPASYSKLGLSYWPARKIHATCRANNNGRYGYDNRFAGTIDGVAVRAKPLKLKQEYFGNAGTITVGLARRNENPWFSIFGRVTGGMYSAFSPVADSWSYCFASAKAGYKLYHVPEEQVEYLHVGSIRRRWIRDWEEKLNGNVRAARGVRDYCIDWKPEETKFAGWYWTYKKDGDGKYVIVNGHRVRDKLVTEWTSPEELHPTWRQSWNLVQDDWDAVMVPVRQGGSRAREVANYSLRDWWQKRLSGQYRNFSDIPDRHEPAWQNRNGRYLASLVNNAKWKALAGNGVPDTNVTAGPTQGDVGDPLNGRLAGEIWEDHWMRGIPPPTATGTSQWNIGHPGAGVDWNKIGDEMYH